MIPAFKSTREYRDDKRVCIDGVVREFDTIEYVTTQRPFLSFGAEAVPVSEPQVKYISVTYWENDVLIERKFTHCETEVIDAPSFMKYVYHLSGELEQ